MAVRPALTGACHIFSFSSFSHWPESGRPSPRAERSLAVVSSRIDAFPVPGSSGEMKTLQRKIPARPSPAILPGARQLETPNCSIFGPAMAADRDEKRTPHYFFQKKCSFFEVFFAAFSRCAGLKHPSQNGKSAPLPDTA
ncbi:hypothetical protein [Agrobacterium sp. OT33]|uniref:hypothetical protein n=1 Tax=Agrobacterium sp. OT33 TaxID=2815338 RepID=UPI001A8FEE15|nr:hypothetical protein [Agrobacterium sp. OT33]MBO0124942.1 hypothetical protein [Agrobacterium sp. OT33]